MSVNYDLRLLDLMLTMRDGPARKRIINKLVLHSEARYPCPDCGDCGPHHVQGYEYACRTPCEMRMKTVFLFAYDPKRHGMIRERVTVDRIEARVAQLRASGWDVGHLPIGANQSQSRRA